MAMDAKSVSSSLEQNPESLPRATFFEVLNMCWKRGFWYFEDDLEGIEAARCRFDARDDDVILASSMKTGTTWLKALCASIVGDKASRHGDPAEDDPLGKVIIHYHMPNLENLYRVNLLPPLSGMPSPRLFHTHMPYNSLPGSIKNSNCRIVYIVRNPKDTFVSLWHFFSKITRRNQEAYPMEEAFESFCKGVHPYGPFFDHAKGYWTESLKMPNKILFLKYEELQRNPKEEVHKLASFLGRQLDEDEVDRVIWRCSLDRLKNLDVHKTSNVKWVQELQVPVNSFFRNGVTGDWKIHLTPEMTQRLDQIARVALEGSGLDLD